MKGYRFYRDIGSDNEGRSLRGAFTRQCRAGGVTPAQSTAPGNVIAVFLDPATNNPVWTARMTWTPGDVPYTAEGYAAVFAHDNSDVAVTGVSWEYLYTCCIRVSESVARAIHPAMFERIASDDAHEDSNDT